MENECVDGNCTKAKEPTIKDRLKAPTPKLFKKLRAIGATLTASGIAMRALPFELNTSLTTMAELLMVGGIVMGIVAQLVTTEASAIKCECGEVHGYS